MQRFPFLALFLVLSLCAPHSAHAALHVFACEPEWGALAQRLGGDRVDVFTATTARQDPHQIQARPSLIAHIARADMVACTGSELEIGWLPLLLRQSSNSKIQVGAPGYFEATRYVQMKEVPTVLDRSLGDVHPGGNPHIQTDPRNFLPVAAALSERLVQLDPGGTAAYTAAHQKFEADWRAAIARWEAKAKPLAGAPVAVEHKSWIYLLDWLGMKEVTALEPKPGVPPSTAYLAEVLQRLHDTPVRMVIHAAYEDDRPSRWLADHAGIPDVELPFTVGGTSGANTLEGLFDQTVNRLVAAQAGQKP